MTSADGTLRLTGLSDPGAGFASPAAAAGFGPFMQPVRGAEANMTNTSENVASGRVNIEDTIAGRRRGTVRESLEVTGPGC